MRSQSFTNHKKPSVIPLASTLQRFAVHLNYLCIHGYTKLIHGSELEILLICLDNLYVSENIHKVHN